MIETVSSRLVDEKVKVGLLSALSSLSLKYVTVRFLHDVKKASLCFLLRRFLSGAKVSKTSSEQNMGTGIRGCIHFQVYRGKVGCYRRSKKYFKALISSVVIVGVLKMKLSIFITDGDSENNFSVNGRYSHAKLP